LTSDQIAASAVTPPSAPITASPVHSTNSIDMKLLPSESGFPFCPVRPVGRNRGHRGAGRG